MVAIRVLVVDDEVELVSALRERLELRGFGTGGAASVTEALTLLAAHRWDVLLLDVRMPGASGLELARRVRAEHPGTAVVLLTGRGSAVDAREGAAVGAFAYLVKPVAIEELARTLRAAAAREENGA